MAINSNRFKSAGALLLIGLIVASPAHAFRCGNKIVIENMHEQQVRKACGEPTTIRHLGYTVRSFDLIDRHSPRWVDFEAELPTLPTGRLYQRLLRDR